MKISKEQFKSYIDLIYDFDKEIIELYEILNYKLIDKLSYIQSGFINYLKCILNDTQFDWIDFFIYETKFGKNNTEIYNEDQEVIANLNSTEALYDFIKDQI